MRKPRQKRYEPGLVRVNIVALQLGPLGTNCYILTSGSDAVVIDPADEPGRILAEIKRSGSRLGCIIYTHAHWDHVGGSGELKKETGAPVYMGKNEAGILGDPAMSLSSMLGSGEEPAAPDTLLSGGDETGAGDVRLRVIDTPGHTPGGISLLSGLDLFSGDALFRGSIGRTDFPGSSHETLVRAIKDRIFSLDDGVRVHPGHGPATSVGWEKRNNPFFKQG